MPRLRYAPPPDSDKKRLAQIQITACQLPACPREKSPEALAGVKFMNANHLRQANTDDQLASMFHVKQKPRLAREGRRRSAKP